MFEVVVVCTAVLMGLLGGWWLRGNDPRWQNGRPRTDDAQRAREILERLRELTHNVAADVDQHKALMGRITDELHASEDQEPTTVVKAVDKLIQSNERMQQQLQSAEAKLEFQAQQLVSHAAEARTDALTTLANRRAFDKAMNEAHQAMAQRGTPTTIMMLDIDRFKSLNDTYGHQAGDSLLRGVASVLRQRTPEGNLVARYGGEEFAIVFPNATLENVERIAEYARRAVGQRAYDFEGLALHVTVSGGLAQLLPGETVAAAIGRSDEALYMSKEQGRDCTHAHNGRQVVRVRHIPLIETPPAPVISPPVVYDVGISSPEVFSSDVRRRLVDWQSGGAPLCVLFVQIDDVEEIRARYGDENCEAAQRVLTLTLKATMREMDHAARFAGDTLSLLLPGCTMRGALTAAERLRTAVARCELPPRYARRHCTISIGVAEALANEDEDSLIDRVRTSLNVARLHGQDCTYLHDGVDFHLIGVGRSSMVK
ncbi:MAG: diguanylate cyclase domain-containing protein [Pirellulaceae bacterium]